MSPNRSICLSLAAMGVLSVALMSVAKTHEGSRAGRQRGGVSTPFRPKVPKTYEDAAMATWHLPLATRTASPAFLPAPYFYARKVRPIYQSFPVYHPDREPAGYLSQIERTPPRILWDDHGNQPKLDSKMDWIRAGELVYDAPLWTRPLQEVSYFRDRTWLKEMGIPVAQDGTLPGVTYLVRESGQLEMGFVSCGTCHTRVSSEGQLVKATQGNFPLAQVEAYEIRQGKLGNEAALRRAEYEYHGTPWHADGPNSRLLEMTLDQLAQAREVLPPGVYPNHNGSLHSPARIADLRGLKRRRYLDQTGHMRHRGPSDLMRFADFHQWGSYYASFGRHQPQTLPDPEGEGQTRYSDPQLYALALYLYSLPQPPSPYRVTPLTTRGQQVFTRLQCGDCHDPNTDYTNHRLTPVDGFTVPTDHPEKAHIMAVSVHTDPTYALKTRKGTGFYKVPSLRGLWRRGPFEHNGSCATLEDWFDPRRLRDDYVPTGWKGPAGTRTRPVRGHEFGLNLRSEDRKALIAFLKTL